MDLTGKKVVAILGMHRSGTSAMTRALKVLGISLGNNFIPTLPEVNRKGFWEDEDINKLNIALLSELDIDWYHWRTPNIDILKSSSVSAWIQQACELLSNRYQEHNWFAFKDPRTSLLIPFWQRVFDVLQLYPQYLIAIRNPLSVADSLSRRNGFDPVRSYYMWLQYMVPCLIETEGSSRLVVDFDEFVQTTWNQVERIASWLDLPIQSSEELRLFVSEFIEPGLRHSVHEAKELMMDKGMPCSVRDVYRMLLQMAVDSPEVDSNRVAAYCQEIANELNKMLPLFGYLDNLENRLARCESRKSAASPVPDQGSLLHPYPVDR